MIEDGDPLVIRHCYVERRMVPLNIYLDRADPDELESAVRDYGNAIRDLAIANIFPGDMLWRNFGVTRHGRVVFYDYDEIEYLTDVNFRRIPEPPNPEAELVGRAVVHASPRTTSSRRSSATFLLGDPRLRETVPARTTPSCSSRSSGRSASAGSRPARSSTSSPIPSPSGSNKTL